MALYATNNYALRAYAEHPTNIWPLDDDAAYLSLITEAQRDMADPLEWTPNAQTTIGTVTGGIFSQQIPFQDSVVNVIAFTSTPVDNVQLGATSETLFAPNDLNADKGSFSINLYVLTSVLASKIDSYEFGISYVDTGSGLTITVPADNTNVIVPNEWMRLSYTFDIPDDTWSDMKMYFNINLVQPVDTGENYAFFVNGLSIGQWSENTSDQSQGAIKETLPASVAINSPSITEGVVAKSYGFSEDDAYYLVQDGNLLASTYGIPMVFGSDNCTQILPSSDGSPSIVFPGLGVMNKIGGNNIYTIEFWLRIENNGKDFQRIWGPTYSSDGLYVGNGCLSFSLNEEFVSYPVNNWYRPMLVSIIVLDDSVSISLNGEVVSRIPYNFNNLYFPPSNEDWVGFYGNDQFELFEIDCYAVYPYAVPSDASKRRFVWGQGVSSPEDINSAFRGTTAYIDYAFSEYDASYKYPGNGRWDAGASNNIDSEEEFIKNPDYVLPEIVVQGNRLYSDFLESNRLLQIADTQPFFYFQPDPVGEIPFIDPVYFLWNNFSPIINDVKSFYAVFEGVEEVTGEEYHPLFSIKNNVSGYTFDALLLPGTTVNDVKLTYRYYLTIDPLDPEASYILQTELPFNDSFVCGFNIDKLYSKRFANFSNGAPSVFEFFSNPNQLRVQVGSDGTNTFTGKTYLVGFADEQANEFLNTSADIDEIVTLVNFVTGLNTALVTTKAAHHFIEGETVTLRNCGDLNGEYVIKDISSDTTFTFDTTILPSNNPFIAPTGSTASCSYFTNDGFTNTYNDNSLYEQMGSYTLLPKLNFDRFYFDIGFSGIWQETYPLSYFAQPVKDSFDSIYWDLDIMQFNVSCPSNYTILKDDQSRDIFTYEELETEYATPTQRSYRELNANFFTYANLKTNTNSALDHYNFTDSETRFFLSFQYAESINILNLSDIETFYALNGNEVIDPSLLTNPLNVAFEAKDRTVLYPPVNTSLQNMVVVLYIQTNCKGIKTSPFKIRQMSIVSKSFDNSNRDRFNDIGTRFGKNIYSYERSSFFFDTQAKVPYAIYTESTPYLYLTKYSGIETLAEPDPGNEYGIAIPINEDKLEKFSITGMQLWMRYSQDFPTVPTTLFNIWHPSGVIYFDIVKDPSADRGIISIRSTNPALSSTLTYSIFQNGIQVKNFYIEKNRWTVLGANFGREINFLSVIGYLNLNPGATFNNISFYESTLRSENSSYIYQVWEDVRHYWETGANLDWLYWKPQTWDNVLRRFVAGKVGINPADLCKTYFGTNRFVVDDDSGIRVSNSFTSPTNNTSSSVVYTNTAFSTLFYQ